MGNVASELQHIGNQIEGSGAEEKTFLTAVYEDKPDEATRLLQINPMLIWAHTKDNLNAWHVSGQSGNMVMLEVLHKFGQGWTKMRKPLPGQPAPVNCKSKNGQTPLMLACEGGHTHAMQYMLAAGAGLLEVDKYGNTALHWAAYRGQAKVLEILLAKSEAEGTREGKDSFVNLRNEAGLTPLHFAAYAGALPAARVLMQYKSNTLEQCESDSMSVVTCSGGSTPLHLAAMKGDVAMATFLLEEWIKRPEVASSRQLPLDPRNVRDAYGLTPLRVAANLQRTAIMPLLDPAAVQLDTFRAAHTFSSPARPTSLFHSTSGRDGQTIVHRQPSLRQEAVASSSGQEHAASTPGGHTHTLAVPDAAEFVPQWPTSSTGGSMAGAVQSGRSSLGDAPGAASRRSGQGAGAWECPAEFMCPITNNVMQDPVVAGDGRAYERSAIEMWFELGSTEYPGACSQARVESRALQPHDELKARIAAWRAAASGQA